MKYKWEQKQKTTTWAELRINNDEVRVCDFNMTDAKPEKCKNGIHSGVYHSDRIYYDDGGSCSYIRVCSRCHAEVKSDILDLLY